MTHVVYLGRQLPAASACQFDARTVRATTEGKPDFEIWQTLSAEFPFANADAKSVASKGPRKCQTPSGKSPAASCVADGIGTRVFAIGIASAFPTKKPCAGNPRNPAGH